MSTDKKLIIAAVIALILAGIAGALADWTRVAQAPSGDDLGDGVVCTADAFRCPDGSYVGRTGPDCQFLCPTGSASSTAANGESSGTGTSPGGAILTGQIIGKVMLGPTCPVMRNPPDPQCADKPYQTTVVVSTAGKEVGREQTDVEGRFSFSFLPGTYLVTALGGTMLPRCAALSVILTQGAIVTADISCDTGIR